MKNLKLTLTPPASTSYTSNKQTLTTREEAKELREDNLDLAPTPQSIEKKLENK